MSRTVRVLLLLAVFAIPLMLDPLLPAKVFPAPISPLEGLELVRRGFSGMTDFTAEITQEKRVALLKKPMTSSGRVRFKRPGFFYMEIDAPYRSRLLLNDNALTMVLPAEGIRQKSLLPPEEGLLHWFALLDRPIARLPDGLEARADLHNGQITLWIVPKEKRGVREIRLTIREDGRPRSLFIEELNRDRTMITFRRVRKNVGLTEEDFRME